MMDNGRSDTYHEAQRTYSRCALITLAVMALMQGLGFLAGALLEGLDLSRSAALLLSQLPVPLVLTAAWLAFRPRENQPRGTDLSPREFPRLLLAVLPVVYGGNLVGSLLASLMTMGTAVNRLETVIGRMDLPLAVYMVLIGPLAEELFFRGALLPRMTRYGEKTALILSALFFALYHVNLYQLFYAFGIGLMLGALYLKTGSVRAGYLLHASVNLLGGVVPNLVLNASPAAVIGFGAAVLTLAVIGIAPLRRLIAETRFAPAPEELPSDIGRRAATRNAGFILLAVLSLLMILADLFL